MPDHLPQILAFENYVNPSLLRAVAATWPADNWSHWHRYQDQYADKRGSKDAHRLPDAARLVIGCMAETYIEDLKPDCFPDLDLHGAGMHQLNPGGFLGLHLDGAAHPLHGWRREVNAILFVDDWLPEWGGHLIFRDADKEETARIIPRRNTLVLFQTSETAWHEVSRIDGPLARRTLSLFWWSHREPASARDRAEFQPPYAGD